MALDLGELSATITADNSRLRRAVRESKSDLDGLGRAVGRIGTGVGFGLLAGGAIQLGAALAPVAGLITAVPAAAAAAAPALFALKLGLDGVGEAIGASLTGDVEAFDAALAELPPNARAVVSELGGAFAGLQDDVQDSFFAPMRSEAQGLADDLRGPVNAGMRDVGDSLGGLGAEVIAFIRTAATISLLEDLFSGVGASIDGARSGVGPFLTGVRDLIGVFVPGLGSMGASIGDALTRWGEWMSAIAASGQALSWFNKAKEVLGQLWSIAGNVSSTLVGIFSAADGSGLLETIEGVTANMAAWANSAEGQDQIATTLGLLGNIASDLMVILPGVGVIIG
ncbi:MAG: hypothetical protein ACRD0P_28090, partial [Stackebrandtia sp.]